MQRNNLYIFFAKFFSFLNAQIQTLNYYIISISNAFVNHKKKWKWNRIIFYSTSLSTCYLQTIVVYTYHFIHRIYSQSNCILLVLFCLQFICFGFRKFFCNLLEFFFASHRIKGKIMVLLTTLFEDMQLGIKKSQVGKWILGLKIEALLS